MVSCESDKSKSNDRTADVEEDRKGEIETVTTLENIDFNSYSIMNYIREPYSVETEEFLEALWQKQLDNIKNLYIEALGEDESVLDYYGQNYLSLYEGKSEFIEDKRRLLYGEYGIIQENPLILKVRNKDSVFYMAEDTYSYFSPNGIVFEYNGKWYEIPGYKNYKDNFFSSDTENYYFYFDEGEVYYRFSYSILGVYNSDSSVSEPSLRYAAENYCNQKTESCCRWVSYMAENLKINGCIHTDDTKTAIYFYCMLSEDKAVTCVVDMNNLSGKEDSFNIDKLKEMFSVREYK